MGPCRMVRGLFCAVKRHLTPSSFTIGAADGYSHLCTIVTDPPKASLTPLYRSKGNLYYRGDYEVILYFGLTEHRAQVQVWNENGVEKRYVSLLNDK